MIKINYIVVHSDLKHSIFPIFKPLLIGSIPWISVSLLNNSLFVADNQLNNISYVQSAEYTTFFFHFLWMVSQNYENYLYIVSLELMILLQQFIYQTNCDGLFQIFLFLSFIHLATLKISKLIPILHI